MMDTTPSLANDDGYHPPLAPRSSVTDARGNCRGVKISPWLSVWCLSGVCAP
ncbi:unnamed protein product [Ectocarpus sp. CCAP 1310/34]|nr:unnamed protein product [Ectocarpus sp. CCAP 1310/34]